MHVDQIGKQVVHIRGGLSLLLLPLSLTRRSVVYRDKEEENLCPAANSGNIQRFRLFQPHTYFFKKKKERAMNLTHTSTTQSKLLGHLMQGGRVRLLLMCLIEFLLIFPLDGPYIKRAKSYSCTIS
jgi:hypothetical protein